MTVPESPAGAGRFDRLRWGLRRTREGILGRIGSLFRGSARSEDWSGELEEALIQADLGPRAAAQIVQAVKGAPGSTQPSWEGGREAARRVLRDILTSGNRTPPKGSVTPPRVVLGVGVNGGGKTTTAGKLGRRFQGEGENGVLCAADTFRAGAGEQLRLWAEQVGAEFVGHRPGADPSAVVFDAASATLSRGADALIVDTAGGVYNPGPLVREVGKSVRGVGGRRAGAAPQGVPVLR